MIKEITTPELGAPEEAQQTWKSDVSDALNTLQESSTQQSKLIEEIQKEDEEQDDRPLMLMTTYGSETEISPFTEDFEFAQIGLNISATPTGGTPIMNIRLSSDDVPIYAQGTSFNQAGFSRPSITISVTRKSLPENILTLTIGSANVIPEILGWTVIQHRSS